MTLSRIILLLMAVIAVLGAVVFKDTVSLSLVKESLDQWSAFIGMHYMLSVLIFCGVYIALVVFSLPFASLLTVSSGALFGFVPGVMMVSLSATIGASMVFFLVRAGVGDAGKGQADNAYSKIITYLSKKPASNLLFVRLLPIFPFFAINIAAGLLKIKPITAIWTCFVGILPGTSLYVYLGQTISEVESLSDLVGPEVFIVFSLIAFLSLTPRMLDFIKNKKGSLVK